MSQDLHSLKIDKSLKAGEPSPWARRWIVGGIALFLIAGAGAKYFGGLTPVEVRTVRAMRAEAGAQGAVDDVILNATGYIVAHHKIQLASKVVGKVAWIGVEKGDRVREGQVIVRLEDDEYKAQLQQAKGQLVALEARLQELLNGSRPEEIQVAKANLDVARADLANAKVNLDRVSRLAEAKVMAAQALDDAKARFDSNTARVASLEKSYELVRIGPRQEQIDQVRGQILQAKGQVAYFETQLANTVIRAPVTGTILERAVEKGEFVTTSFVGERGAKGYVVSVADLNDLQVELDISQNDFGKLSPRHRGIITTDSYRDRKYDGVIEEMSPEANRQKATVQVKVKVLNPDSYLRPEMNASVAFLALDPGRRPVAGPAQPAVFVPAGAVRSGAVFVAVNGKAVRRAVKAGASTSQGVRIEDGLIGGEDVIVDPPAGLADSARIKLLP
ncbi:MAG: efflux RND transporter periplasmic adaptor subunit [Acidobacteria bacterium]|nr:efflux RND transporter periplasmic adaptor subunit [Acidobacteriota bacterium]